MRRKIVLFLDYNFKKEPYGSKKEPFYVTAKNFRYKVELPETKINLKLTLEEIKEKYRYKALSSAALNQMNEYGDFINKI